VWKILLGIKELNATRYQQLIELGPSAQHYHVCQDSFRTFGTDDGFKARVNERATQRVMNAFFHAAGHNIHSYVQGLNLFAGMFLYVMPELDAFHCFERFISFHCPRYASGSGGVSGVADATKVCCCASAW
jgi:cell cycle arrest protein BUB2